MEESFKCVICRLPASASLSMDHECGHRSHGKCLPEDPSQINFEKCDACMGKIDLSKPLLLASEPRTTDGWDYVIDPLTSEEFDRIRTEVFAKGDPNLQPLILMREGPAVWPVDRLIREKGLGLQHMLAKGVCMSDFVQSGYGWDQLCLYEDLAGKNGQERGRMALSALGTSVDHFADYPQLLPAKTIRKELGITAPILCATFGLGAPENGYLGSDKHDAWKASHCVELGLSLADLIDFAGLRFVEQWQALEPTEEEMRKMNATKETVARLQSYFVPVIMEEQSPIQIVHNPRQQILPRIVEQNPVYQPRRKQKIQYHGLRKRN
jgi:hypothetical protein